MKTFFKVFLIHFSLLVLLGVSFMSGFSFHAAEAETYIYLANNRDDPVGLDSMKLASQFCKNLNFVTARRDQGRSQRKRRRRRRQNRREQRKKRRRRR